MTRAVSGSVQTHIRSLLARSGTTIPLTAGGAQEDETLL